MATCTDDKAHVSCLIKIIPLDKCLTHLNINNLNTWDYIMTIVKILSPAHMQYVTNMSVANWAKGVAPTSLHMHLSIK